MVSSKVRQRGSVDIVLLVVALVVATQLLQAVYQTVRLSSDLSDLKVRREAQAAPLTEVEKVRSQLEALAGATATLAESGNVNARNLAEQLRAQGVTIRPPVK